MSFSFLKALEDTQVPRNLNIYLLLGAYLLPDNYILVLGTTWVDTGLIEDDNYILYTLLHLKRDICPICGQELFAFIVNTLY